VHGRVVAPEGADVSAAAQFSLFAPAPVQRMVSTLPERPRRTPRPYQDAAIAAFAEKLGQHRSTLFVCPTGGGKTFTAATFIERHVTGGVLWLAHREELIDQGIADLTTVVGELVAKEKAEAKAYDTRIVVASVQTLKGDRIADFAQRIGAPQLIVVDEAHHAVAPSYRKILEAFPDAKVLGLTATPDRTDERAMGQVFDSVAFVYEIRDAIRDKFLCPIRINRVQVDAIDLRAVKTVAGDLNQGELDAVMSAEEVLHGVVKPTIELAGKRRTIVFTTSVDNAHRMAEIFNRYVPGSARAVDGGTDQDERRRTLTDHKAGAYQFLCNVGVLTEGYDDPGVSCIAMARPTKSRALYAQCAGRGLRIMAGKEDCLLLDFAGNAGKHALASALDILGGKFDDEVVARAREIVEREGGALAEEALERAAKEIEAQRAREAARRAKVQGKVKYSTQQIDPFAVLHIDQGDDGEYAERFGMTATEKQIASLERAGIEIPGGGMSRAAASRLLGSVFKRRELHLASFKQLKTLRKYGITDLNVGFKQASSIIDAIAGNNWRPLPPGQLASLMERQPGEDMS
jgi:superfamily II DNA or RNA helicase